MSYTFFSMYGLGLVQCADTHPTLLGRVVSGASYVINWGVLECNIELRRSVAVLCMLFK